MLKNKLTQLIQKSLSISFPNQSDLAIIVEYPRDKNHGDYSCTLALQLAKSVQKSPREIAEILIENIEKPNFVDTIEIAGPGFINFFVSKMYLLGVLRGILVEGENYGKNKTGHGKSVIVEYSSPNTNKPLHLGHARNNFLGMAVSRLLENNGYDVLKTQIVNDRGIHICKSMLAYQRFGRNTSPDSLGKKGDHFVGDYYVKYGKMLKDNPSLEVEARLMLQKWENNDPLVRGLWRKMNNWVWEGFTQTYELIGSHFDFSTFESDIAEEGRTIIETALKEGKVERIEGGALAIDLAIEGLGDRDQGKKILIRSDGTTMYITQDIQLAVKRMEKEEIERVIYVVGNEQNYHLKVLFKILEKLGFKWAKKCYHLSYGMVDLPSGKMKSREGTSVDIDNLVNELEKLVGNEIAQRNLDYPETEQADLKRAIALGALKYFILKVDAKSRMLYDPNSSIDFQGDTGPYLQYTYARLQAILRKAPEADQELANVTIDNSLFPNEPEEIALLKKLQLYPELVLDAAQDYRIHSIAIYLNELAQLANSFYTKTPVLEGTSPELRIARLQLVTGVTQVLKNGLNILGIEAVKRM
ncbi:MAG: arginyl-tRNA synthetase, arginyl-tRNA synthetase [Candidatus Peregrinibacteria bacterium GW2011_GWF2_39_17]|nr:MAG: arginyl-tRNA synthetase, arginyl-tRNA synthetase [Candidatus Peregrinibacteria bacterium GW2011_GWF2_39_17]HCW32359.1 arginine--tRNA ligase [Candidatus Peregrinibacteria bacterium]